MTTEKELNQIFVREIRLLWSAEKMLTETMPAMIEKAAQLGLKKNLAHHLVETDQHKVALEAICKQFGIAPEGEMDEDMKTILSEGQAAISNETTGQELDATLIAGAIEIESYEIANYEAAAKHAEALGYAGIAKRLYLTFEEERQAYTKLRFLEKTFIYQSAAMGEPIK